MRRWLFLPLLTAACFGTCETEAPIDYEADANWLCRDGVGGPCLDAWRVASVAEGGTVTEETVRAAQDPDLACFVVYPTIDLTLWPALHTDVETLPGVSDWTRRYAAPLAEVCSIYVPKYRQVSIGTYAGEDTARKDQCFDSAFDDVAAAFEAFLADEPTRGIVLFGHSQGGQHLSRLIRERIETDPAVAARLVGAYPLGWALGTAEDSLTGGSFEDTPVCASERDPGCVVGFRSFLKDEAVPEVGRLAEGDDQVCVHPGRPGDPAASGLLAGTLGHSEMSGLRRPAGVTEAPDLFVLWPDGFEARCTEAGPRSALEVRWVRDDRAPFDLSSVLLTGSNGTHILDTNLGLPDVVADIERRGAVWAERP